MVPLKLKHIWIVYLIVDNMTPTLFTVGPVNEYEEIISSRSKNTPYFRTEEFSNINFTNARLIKKFTNADEQSEVIFLTCSGTGAMEATIHNCFNKDDNVLIINGGTFGNRFCEICDRLNIRYSQINLKFGEMLRSEHFESIDGSQYTGLLVNIDETSTGQLYNIELISNFCKRYSLFLVVDAISSFLADDINIKKFGINALIISSQKGLSLSPGLSIVVLDEKILLKMKSIKVNSLYFDLNIYIKDNVRGQTPFTPAVGIILELNEMLQLIDKKGIENILKDTANKARYFREKIMGLPLIVPEYPLSNALTPLIFPQNNAKVIFEILKTKYEIVVTPSGGDLKDKMLRVAHIGNTNYADYDRLIDSLMKLL